MRKAQQGSSAPAAFSMKSKGAGTAAKSAQGTHARSAGSQGPTRKMAIAIITIKLMMDSPDTDLASVEEKAKEIIKAQNAQFYKAESEEVAFGLKALKVTLSCDEKLGSDLFEEKLSEIDGVGNAQCIDFRRALG